jgi:hypothetical protein
MSRIRPVAIALIVLAIAIPSFAQRTTGSILGTVTDESGGVLPGVTVTLTGANVVGTQSSVTSERGGYRFAALPPGDYTVIFTMSGFSTMKRDGVKVPLGGTVEENVGMKVSSLSDEITVSGEAPVINTASNQVSTNYDKDWVRNAPMKRYSFFDLIAAAPGVNQSTSNNERATSFGSATTDNSYQLDGTDFTAPLTGAAWPFPNTDAIEEIEILSLGAPAEYGNLQGAVFNLVTRQGSNDFHGDLNYYHQSQGLTSSNTTAEQDDGFPYTRVKFNDYTAQISGPVIKNKLWFFASYQHQANYEAPAGVPKEFPTKQDANRVFGKINWQISDRNKLMFAYHDDYYRLPGSSNALTDPNSVTVEHGHNPSPNLTFTSVRSDRTYIEARVSGFYGKDHGDPIVDGQPRVKPRFLDFDTGETLGGIYSWYDGTSDKSAASAKISHFADHFMGGSHDFKFGVQFNSGGSDYATGPNDYIYTYSGVPSYGYTQVPYHSAGRMRALGFFFDDTYRIGPRLTVNFGARYDNSKASFEAYPILDKLGDETGASTSAVDKLFTWNVVSPRLGFTYKITEDGKTVLKGHWGRYYRGIVTGEFTGVTPSITPRFLFDGTYDDAGNPQNLELVSDISNLHVDPNFKDPTTDQFILSFEREIAQNLGVSVNYVYKKGKDYGGWIDTAGTYESVPFTDETTGKTLNLLRLTSEGTDRQFLLTNPDQMFTKYNGATFQLTKRMSNHWQSVVSLVLSRSTGRLGSSLLGPFSRQSGISPTFGQNPNDYINTDGRLIEDRPFVFKTQFFYELPKGFQVGFNFIHQSGRPYGRTINPSDFLGIPSTVTLLEPIDGSLRVANSNVLDIRAQKDITLSGDIKLGLFLDVLNLFNNAANENVGSRLVSSDAFGRATDIIYPRRAILGAKIHF